MPNISYCNLLRAHWRFLRFCGHVFWGVIWVGMALRWQDRHQQQLWLQKWSRQLLNILRIKVICERASSPTVSAGFWVSNHVSWLDIFVLMSIEPSRFVAKKDIQSWPIMGHLIAKAGTVFIARENKAATHNVANALVQHLLDGECVTVFPEGTSSNGKDVLPFKSSLFQAACTSEVAIQPWALRYENQAAQQVTQHAYCQNVSFWQSLQPLLLNQCQQVRVARLPVIELKSACRKKLSEHSHQTIRQQMRTWQACFD